MTLSGVEWGKDFTTAEVEAIFAAAADTGINFIDTAECYGDHLAERLIGAALAGQRERWAIDSEICLPSRAWCTAAAPR